MAADPAAAGHEARRVALFTLIAWLPIVLLATLQGYALNEHHGRAVVLDFSAYAFLIAVAAFVLQTLPACDEPFDDGVGKVAGFSLDAGVAARADERNKLERLCRYISRRLRKSACRSARTATSGTS